MRVGMAERRADSRPTVQLAYAFDRLLDAKLQNVYAVLAPDQAHKIPARTHDVGEDHEDRSPVRAGLGRAAER